MGKKRSNLSGIAAYIVICDESMELFIGEKRQNTTKRRHPIAISYQHPRATVVLSRLLWCKYQKYALVCAMKTALDSITKTATFLPDTLITYRTARRMTQSRTSQLICPHANLICWCDAGPLCHLRLCPCSYSKSVIQLTIFRDGLVCGASRCRRVRYDNKLWCDFVYRCSCAKRSCRRRSTS